MTKTFKEFIDEFELVTETLPLGDDYPGHTYETTNRIHPSDRRWWFDPDSSPGHDFNRDILHPGHIFKDIEVENKDPDYVKFVTTNGILQIRADDDFWVVGVFPYEYATLSIQEIVATAWPHIMKPRFNPDSDDLPAWDELYADIRAKYPTERIED